MSARGGGLLTLLLAAAAGACGVPANATDGAAPSDSSWVARRIAAGEGLGFLGEVSPDGRFLSRQDPATLGLAVQDLSSGESRLVAFDSTATQYALSSAFSSDGLRLAYTWFNTDETLELRVVNLDGTGVRTLYRDDGFIDYAWPADWSPDGRNVVAVVQAKDGSTRLMLLDAETGARRVLKSFDWRTPGSPTFSPDGRFVAYDFAPAADSPARELYLLALERGREARLTEGAGEPRLLGWEPSGEGLVYAAGAGAAEGLWLLPLEDGRPSGAATLLQAAASRLAQPLGASGTAIFYGLAVEEPQLYQVVLEDGRVEGPPTLLSEPRLGRALGPAWSPDGGHLAYVVRPTDDGRAELYVRSEAGALRALPVRMNGPRKLTWAPDGRSLFAAGWDKGPPGVFKIDLVTLAARQLVRIEPAILLTPVLTPDGATLFFSRYEAASDQSTLYAFDLAADEERRLHTAVGRLSNLALSPDARTLAFTLQRESDSGSAAPGELVTRLLLLQLGGGEPRQPHTLRGFIEFDALRWSADGAWLLYVRHVAGSARRALERVSVAGGEPERLLELEGMRHLRVHPDGRRLAFQAGVFKGEVWTLERQR